MGKVLLISPRTEQIVEGENQRYDVHATHPPLGLAYLAAVLIEHGHTVQIEDLGLSLKSDGELTQAALAFGPDVVGLTSYALSYDHGLALCRELKAVLPDTAIIFGGPQASFLPRETLESAPVDAVALFEGEETMLELTEYFTRGTGSLGSIRGIAFGRGPDFTVTPRRPLIENLDELPRPARQLLSLMDYPVPGTIITGRGCTSNCIFCSANVISGRRARHRSPEAVFAEMRDLAVEYGLRKFNLVDDTVTSDRHKIITLSRLLQQADLDIIWGCESRVDEVDAELLQTMYQGGCRQIHFGVESGNEEVIRRIGKGINLEQVRTAVQAAVDSGMKVVCSFIVGHPRDTQESVWETIEFARSLRRMSTERAKVITPFGILTPYPGSKIEVAADKLGLKILTRDWKKYTLDQVVIEHQNLSASDLKRFWSLAMREYNQMPTAQLRFQEEHV